MELRNVPFFVAGGTIGALDALVREYVHGVALSAIDDSFVHDDFRLSVGVEISATLREIHALNYVHRDVKPDNILVDDFGRPHIIDFGIWTIVGAPYSSLDVAGTVGFMCM